MGSPLLGSKVESWAAQVVTWLWVPCRWGVGWWGMPAPGFSKSAGVSSQEPTPPAPRSHILWVASTPTPWPGPGA